MKYAILVGQHSQLCENRVSSSHSSQINSKLASHLPELPLITNIAVDTFAHHYYKPQASQSECQQSSFFQQRVLNRRLSPITKSS